MLRKNVSDCSVVCIFVGTVSLCNKSNTTVSFVRTMEELDLNAKVHYVFCWIYHVHGSLNA